MGAGSADVAAWIKMYGQDETSGVGTVAPFFLGEEREGHVVTCQSFVDHYLFPSVLRERERGREMYETDRGKVGELIFSLSHEVYQATMRWPYWCSLDPRKGAAKGVCVCVCMSEGDGKLMAGQNISPGYTGKLSMVVLEGYFPWTWTIRKEFVREYRTAAPTLVVPFCIVVLVLFMPLLWMGEPGKERGEEGRGGRTNPVGIDIWTRISTSRGKTQKHVSARRGGSVFS